MGPKSYHRDLTDKQWETTMAYLPQHQGWLPFKMGTSEIINAILSMVTTGSHWSVWPYDFPPE